MLNPIGGAVIVNGGGLWYSGEGSRPLYPSECKHCDPLLRKWLSNQSVESIVAKGNFYAIKVQILKVKLSGKVLDFMNLGSSLCDDHLIKAMLCTWHSYRCST